VGCATATAREPGNEDVRLVDGNVRMCSHPCDAVQRMCEVGRDVALFVADFPREASVGELARIRGDDGEVAGLGTVTECVDHTLTGASGAVQNHQQGGRPRSGRDIVRARTCGCVLDTDRTCLLSLTARESCENPDKTTY